MASQQLKVDVYEWLLPLGLSVVIYASPCLVVRCTHRWKGNGAAAAAAAAAPPRIASLRETEEMLTAILARIVNMREAEQAETAAANRAAEEAANRKVDEREVLALAEETAENHLICPISFGLLTDPVVASDGHAYQRDALVGWIQTCAQGQT